MKAGEAMAPYFGLFNSLEDMLEQWRPYQYDETTPKFQLKEPLPVEGEVLFASYGAKDYEGDAFVLFEHDGKLYESNGSH